MRKGERAVPEEVPVALLGVLPGALQGDTGTMMAIAPLAARRPKVRPVRMCQIISAIQTPNYVRQT